MENQPIANSSGTPPVNSVPINQISTPQQTKTNLLIPMLLTVLVSAAVSAFGGYYLGKQFSVNQPQNLLNQNQTGVTPSVNLSPTAVTTSPAPTQNPMESEVGNVEMKSATKIISSDGKHHAWLDGKNFTATQLWTSNVDGSQMKLIVIGTDSSGNAKVGDYSLVSPVWSPDGIQVAYLRAVIDNIGQLDVTDKLDLYIINRDGTNDHLVKSNISTSRGQYGKTDLNWTSEGITYTDNSSSVPGVKVTVQPK
jgi:hypothetical protein